MGDVRRHLLPGRRLARRRLPRRPGGLLLPARLRHHRAVAIGDEHVLAVEVTCSPQAGTRNGATSPASSSSGRASTATGTRAAVAPGSLLRHRAGPDRPSAGPVPRRRRAPRPPRARRPARQRRPAHRPVGRCSTATVADEQDQVIASGDNEFEWSIDITDPTLWWPRSLGDSRSSRSRSRSRSTASSATGASGEPGSARSTGATGSARSTASGCSSRAPTCRRPRPAWPTPTRRRPTRRRVRRRPRARRAPRVTATSAIATCTSPPTSSASSCCRTSRCNGATPARCATGGRQARAAVDTLGHHPSIVQWTAHNDPSAPTRRRAAEGTSGDRPVARPAAPDVEPLGARPLGQALLRARRPQPPDRRPLRRGSPPSAARRHRQPPLVRLGQRGGDRPRAHAARLPRRVRFVSEFGAESSRRRRTVHRRAAPTPPLAEPRLGSLVEDHGYDRASFERLFPPADYPTSRRGGTTRSTTSRTCSRCRSRRCAG